MLWVNVPNWFQRLFPKLIWKIPSTEKTIYFTFDDGPTPQVTPKVLDFLFQYNAKATFFCTGSKAEKYPELVAAIRNAGHVVGNHGYKHISGLFSKTTSYLENANKGAAITQSNLFRPPYGRIMPWQINAIKSMHSIVQWSIMGMDFKLVGNPGKCYKNVVDNASSGYIVVFHDTEQAEECLAEVLPRLLKHFTEEGYDFRTLKSNNLGFIIK